MPVLTQVDVIAVGLLIASVAGILLGVYLVVWGVNGIRRGFSVWSNDPIPIADAHLADGTIEVEGTAESLVETVNAPYSGRSCLAYSSKKERKERERNDDGDWETNWKTVSSSSGSVPFDVVDETGSIPVDPGEATLGMDREYSSRSGDVRRRENRIDTGDDVHVIGQRLSVTEKRPELGDAAEYIGDGDDAPTFRVTDGSELETVARMFGRSAASVLFGVLLAGVFVFLFIETLPEL